MLYTNVKAVFVFIVFGLGLLGIEVGLEMGWAGLVVRWDGGGVVCGKGFGVLMVIGDW